MKRWEARLSILAALMLIALLIGTPAAAKSPPAPPSPPKLSGEQFLQSGGGSFTLACNADQTGTFTYTNSGIATGPYPGPYSETGSVTIGTAGTSLVVTALTATFEITAATGYITGITIFDQPGPGGVFCAGTVAHASAYARYTATIPTSNGPVRDVGTSLVVAEAGTDFGTYLNEVFNIMPTSRHQCKNGGWQTFQQFRNQGDCLIFVVREGKNRPGREITAE